MNYLHIFHPYHSVAGGGACCAAVGGSGYPIDFFISLRWVAGCLWTGFTFNETVEY